MRIRWCTISVHPISFPTVTQQHSERTVIHHTKCQLLRVLIGRDVWRSRYDWLAPGWGWGNPGTIAAAGFRVVSTLGLYISSDQDNTDWLKYYQAHPLECAAHPPCVAGSVATVQFLLRTSCAWCN